MTTEAAIGETTPQGIRKTSFRVSSAARFNSPIPFFPSSLIILSPTPLCASFRE